MPKNRQKITRKKLSSNVHKPNPFDLKFSKMKQQILGRKLPAEGKYVVTSRGNTGKKVSQSRNSILLREYRQFGKDNKFVDRRIGERKAPDGYRMTVEEKMAKRFTMERAHRSKKLAKYNLNDDPREASLSHLGQSLATIERFERPVDVDDPDDGGLDAEFVSQVHFGGMEGDNDNPNLVSVRKPGASVQNRKMALNDLIRQSKLAKHERQSMREETLDKTEELDKKWKSLLGTPALGTLSKFSVKPDPRRVLDGFDMLVHQMQFESRAGKAADKILTEDEKIKVAEKKSKLADKKKKEKAAKGDTTRVKEFSIDDLERLPDSKRRLPEDRFSIRYSTSGELLQQSEDCSMLAGAGKHRHLHHNLSSFSEDESSGSEGYDDDNENIDDDEDSSASDEQEQQSENEGDRCSENGSSSSSYRDAPLPDQNSKRFGSTAAAIKLPESYEDFRQLFEQKIDHRTSSKPFDVNKDHIFLQLCGLVQRDAKIGGKILLYHFRYLDEIAEKVTCQDDGNLVGFIDSMYRHLQKLLKVIPPDQAEKCCVALTKRYLNNYQNQKVTADQAAKINSVDPANSALSSPRHVPIQAYYYLRALPRLFLATDVSHPVLSPALAFITEVMKGARIRTIRDVAKYLALCSIWLDYLDQFHRYTPELVCFVLAVLQMAQEDLKGERPIVQSLLALDIHVPLLYPRTDAEIDDEGGEIGIEDVFETEMRISKQICIRKCVEVLRTLSSLWEQLVSYVEIFDPVVKVLKQLPLERFSEATTSIVEEAISDFERLIDAKTGAKMKTGAGKKSPGEFKFLEPRMDLNFDPDSKKKISGKGVKAEVKKLTRQVKNETRGAVRELRRDSQFLARTKLQEQLNKDAVRKRKTNALMGSLMQQEGDYNKLKRMK